MSHVTIVAALTPRCTLASHVIMAIGGYSSSTTVSVAAMTIEWQLPLLSYGGWTDKLGSPEDYPFFVRVCIATNQAARAYEVVTKFMRWKTWAILITDDAYATIR